MPKAPHVKHVKELLETANEAMVTAEEVCRRDYPEVVNEVLELLAPWCDPNLDMEFKAIPDGEEHVSGEKVLTSLFWNNSSNWDYVLFHHLNRYSGDNTLAQMGDSSEDIGDDIARNVFAKELEVRQSLDASFGCGAVCILDNCHILGLVEERLKKTGAYRYGLLKDQEMESIASSILIALNVAVSFMGVGDHERANALKPFLELQRSGTPVVYRENDWVHVLCL